MAVDLPSTYKPSSESTVNLLPNTRVDTSQDGTPFVRVLGPKRNRVSVVVQSLSDFDSRGLLSWLETNRTETINVTLDGATYSGKLMGEPTRNWVASNLADVSFEVMG